MSAIKLVAIKLNTGEEIIARYINKFSEATSLTITQPRRVGIMPMPNGEGVTVGMLPWFLCLGDNSVEIGQHSIVAQLFDDEIEDELAKLYLSKTSSIDLTGTMPGLDKNK